MTVLDLRSPTVDIFDEPGDDYAIVLTLLDEDGDPFDASGYTLEAVVVADVETPPTFDIVVSGAGNNIVTLTMSDATEIFSGDYTLTATLDDSTTTWLSGSLVLIPGGRGSGNGTQEVTVNIGTTILATVVLGAAASGGGGGAPSGPAGGVLSGTYPNPGFAADMATQAELDAVSAVANAAQPAGTAAGGVLSGTYPNPGFAADMATQAELDAVSTVANAAQPAGAAAGGVLSGTYPNPGFAADMATQAELDAVSTVANAAVPNALFDANSILYATSDNTPLALTVAASRVVGRKASGDIDDLTGPETAAILAGEVFKQAQEINAQTGTSYTLVAGDAGKLVTMTNGSASTLDLPQDSAATIAIGSYVDISVLGAGQLTVQAGSGATLRVSGLTAKSRAQYSRLGAQKIAANTWQLFGDLAAS